MTFLYPSQTGSPGPTGPTGPTGPSGGDGISPIAGGTIISSGVKNTDIGMSSTFTITHTSTGVYDLQAATAANFNQDCAVIASLMYDNTSGSITTAPYNNGITVRTFNSLGVATDLGFAFLCYFVA